MGNKKILGLFKGILAILLVSILLIQPLSMRVFAVGNNDIPTGNESLVSNMKVEVLIDGHWANHYNVRIKLTNTGSDTIHSWSIGTKTQDKIEGLYNALEISDSLGKDDESIKIFNHTSYNQDIYPGDSVEFGYTAVYSGSFDVPNEFIDASCLAQVENKNFKVKKEVISNWYSGGIGNITVYNNSDKTIEDWTIEFDSKCEIKEVWNGKLISNNNGHYVITNPGYNQNIDRHSQITIGVLYGKNVYSSINNTALSCMSINDISVLFPDYEKDTDEDGLPDFYEDEIGTDKNKVDTDGDGLSDYEEEFDTLTDPLIYDSVIDGVPDSDVDLDEDGFTNKYELEIGTDPYFEDTDFDGLRDDEEINTYKTNPVKRDTDEDGITDGDEILLGLNPLKNDSDDDGINDSEEVITQKVDKENFEEEIFDNNVAMPSLSVNAKGNINKRIKIEYVPTYLIGDERAIIGKGIDIINSPSEGGKLTFTLPSDYKFEKYVLDGKETEGLLIEYYNQEEVIPLKTTVDTINKTISADIVGDGWYYILYMPGYLNIFGYEMPSDGNSVLNESGYYVEISPFVTDDTTEIEFAENIEEGSEINEPISEESEELSDIDSDDTDKELLLEEDNEEELEESELNEEEENLYDDSNEMDLEDENQNIEDTSLYVIEDQLEQSVEDTLDGENSESDSIENEGNEKSEEEQDSLPNIDSEELGIIEDSESVNSYEEEIPSETILSGMNYFNNTKDIRFTNLIFGETDVDFVGVDNPGETNANEGDSEIKKSGNPKTKDINAVVDIVFVFDTTGSMGSAVENTQKNLGIFADILAMEGITVSYGLVDYKDIEPDHGYDESRIVKNGYSNWFHSNKDIKSAIRSLSIDGGGDGPECALDGLALAQTMDFRSNAQKFIILVTDATNKNNNEYGKTSLDEIAGEFAEEEICVSVIAPNWQECTADYDVLCEKTGGIYVDIYSDFATELSKIADKIKEYSKGYWIALDTPVPTIVRLDEKPKNGSLVDTDKDDLLDCEELIINENELKCVGFNTQLELAYGGDIRFDYKQLQVYPFSSNPIRSDSDVDGMCDKWDSEPLNSKVGIIIYRLSPQDSIDNFFNASEAERTGAVLSTIEDYQYGNLSQSDMVDQKIGIKDKDFKNISKDELYNTFLKNYIFYLPKKNKKEYEELGTDMINHFADGTGSIYKDSRLTKTIIDDKNSKKYVNDVADVIKRYYSVHYEDLSGLVYDPNNRKNELITYIKNSAGEYVADGMQSQQEDLIIKLPNMKQHRENKLLIHSLTDVQIELVSYDVAKGKFTMRVTYYDIFGVDAHDIEEHSQAMFKAWYVLQHYNVWKGEYVPYVDVISQEKEYSFTE